MISRLEQQHEKHGTCSQNESIDELRKREEFDKLTDKSMEIISKQDKNEFRVHQEATLSLIQSNCQVPVDSTQESPEAIEEIHDYPPERNSKETPKLLEIDKTPG